MNDLNFLIIIGIVILITAIFSLIIYLIQKKLFDIMKSNIQNTNNEKELDFREQRISNLIEPLNSQLQILNKGVNEIEKNRIESYGRLSSLLI